MGFKASSSWFLASKGFVLSSTSARAWLGLLSKVEEDGEVRVVMRIVYNLVAKVVLGWLLDDMWVKVVPTSVPVKWLPFTNRNSDEAQTSEHDSLFYGGDSYSTKARRESFRDYKTSRLQDMGFLALPFNRFCPELRLGSSASFAKSCAVKAATAALPPPLCQANDMALKEIRGTKAERRGIRVPKEIEVF
ncbi:hypothetical protein Tco_1530130 [Tanacetum coccineum]